MLLILKNLFSRKWIYTKSWARDGEIIWAVVSLTEDPVNHLLLEN